MDYSSAPPQPVLISGDTGGHDRTRVLVPVVDGAPELPAGNDILTLNGHSMGTTWQVSLVASHGQNPTPYRVAIEAELNRIISLFSPWVADSEISRFNAAAPGWVPLADDFMAVLMPAMDWAARTDGAVDPTLGALVDLWGFGPPGPRPFARPVPSISDIAATLAVSGHYRLEIDAEKRAVRQPGGMCLDFSGIAKGHAVDSICERLRTMGSGSHLIEVGGELRGEGIKPDYQPWWVEIDRAQDADTPRTVAALYDMAVATSGDWRRHIICGGKIYSHTINGHTGWPVNNDVAQVTVFDRSAMRADTLATALTVMGVEAGLELARQLNVAAHFTWRNPDGTAEAYSPAYAAMMEDEA